jgi:hypothetical protein
VRPSAILGHGENPYAVPRNGSPARIAFVGQSTFFEACALASPATTFVEFRAGADADAMRAKVLAFAPDAVVVFRPEILPAGVFAGLRAPVLGVLTEPIPRTGGHRAHPDLLRRRFALSKMDPGNLDRLVAFDPLIVPIADAFMPVWRSLPLPVADRLYAPVRPPSAKPSILFVGRSTEHREWVLTPAKHAHDVVHYAHGLVGAAFSAALAAADVGIALHAEPGGGFPAQAPLHLAAGQLLLSERLSPPCGLEPGIDFLQIDSREGLMALLHQLSLRPDAYERVRVRGRLKAEEHRASRVWPRIVADLVRDLRAFGTARTLHA